MIILEVICLKLLHTRTDRHCLLPAISWQNGYLKTQLLTSWLHLQGNATDNIAQIMTFRNGPEANLEGNLLTVSLPS